MYSLDTGNGSNLCQDPSCLLQPFAGLCHRDPSLDACWMLNVVNGCTVIYTNICGASSETQQISINSCQVIYQCWFPFKNKSVCFYLHSGVSTQPIELLYLASMNVEEARWVLLPSRESVFTPGRYTGAISLSVGLFGTVNIESDSDAAVFLIGKGNGVHRIELLFMPVPVDRRFTPVCEEGHKVIHVLATWHDVLVICDNKAYWINIGKWSKPIEIALPEPSIWTFTGATTNPYVLETSGGSVGLIAQSAADGTVYCFTVSPPSQYPLQCGVILNVTLTHGMLITRGDISNTQFLALFDGYVIGVMNMSSNHWYETVTTDFCHPQDDCLFIQGDVVYIGSGQRTMILDKDTFEIITTQDVDLCEVLSMNSLTYSHKEVLSPSPISSNSLTSTVVGSSFAIIQTTTISFTATSTGTASLYSIFTQATTFNINLPTSTTSDVDATVDPTTVDSAGVDSTTADLTISGPYNTESPSVNNTIPTNTAKSSEIDTKSKFYTISIIIALGTLAGLLGFVVILLAAKRYYCTRKLETDYREKVIHRVTEDEIICEVTEDGDTGLESAIQPASDSDELGGEVVMPPTETGMYEPTSTTTTITEKTTTQTATMNTSQKVFVSTQHS